MVRFFTFVEYNYRLAFANSRASEALEKAIVKYKKVLSVQKIENRGTMCNVTHNRTVLFSLLNIPKAVVLLHHVTNVTVYNTNYLFIIYLDDKSY